MLESLTLFKYYDNEQIYILKSLSKIIHISHLFYVTLLNYYSTNYLTGYFFETLKFRLVPPILSPF